MRPLIVAACGFRRTFNCTVSDRDFRRCRFNRNEPAKLLKQVVAGAAVDGDNNFSPRTSLIDLLMALMRFAATTAFPSPFVDELCERNCVHFCANNFVFSVKLSKTSFVVQNIWIILILFSYEHSHTLRCVHHVFWISFLLFFLVKRCDAAQIYIYSPTIIQHFFRLFNSTWWTDDRSITLHSSTDSFVLFIPFDLKLSELIRMCSIERKRWTKK